MTEEEINKLAEDCSYHYQGRPVLRGYELSNRLTIQSYAAMAFKWLLKDYCIVPKDVVRAIYNRKTIPTQEDITKKFIEECVIDAIFPDLLEQ